MGKYSPSGLICIVTGKPAEYHHVRHRASGGTDDPFNMIAVSRDIHSEWHARGTRHMASKHHAIAKWLKDNNWYFDLVLMKYVNRNYQK
jgi:hypothetical protein